MAKPEAKHKCIPLNLTRVDRWVDEVLISGDNSPSREWVAGVLWLIWKAQNAFVFQFRPSNPGVIVDDSLLSTSSYSRRNPQKLNRGKMEKTSCEHWSPPSTGTWKFSVDGSWLEGSQEGLVAGVHRDYRGMIIVGFASKANASFALEIEALAMKDALLWLWEASELKTLPDLHVVILADSLLTIRCL